MSEVKWIKITTSMFDDRKMMFIETLPEKDTIYYIWIRLLMLAGKINENGLIFVTEDIPYNDEVLSQVFNRPLNTVKMAIGTFKKLNMINEVKGHINISNWLKHQNVEGLDKIREDNRIRQAKHREKCKLIVMSRDSNVTNECDSSISNSDSLILNSCIKIYEYWKTKDKLQGCIKLPKKMESLLKDYPYTEEQIIHAIDNYNTVLSSPSDYWFTYKWSLLDFIQRGKSETNGCAKFVDDACIENFKKKDFNNKPQQQERKDKPMVMDWSGAKK